MKKVSIIMLAYNKLPYTKVSIESLYYQTPEDLFELICVNNGSSDGTQEYLESIPGIKVIHFPENVGGDRAFNEALKYVQGEYTVFLNNDIVLSKNWLQQLITVMESDPKIGIVVPVCNSSSNYQAIQIEYQTIEEFYEFSEKFNHTNPALWEERHRLMLYVAIFRTEELKAMGGLDEVYSPGGFDDDDIGCRYRRAGYKLIFTKDTYIHHYGSVTIGEGTYASTLGRNRKVFIGKFGVDSWSAAAIDIEVVLAYRYSQVQPKRILGVGKSCAATILQLKNEYKAKGSEKMELTYYALEPSYITDLKTLCEEVYQGELDEIVEQDRDKYYEIIHVESDEYLASVSSKLVVGGEILLTYFWESREKIKQKLVDLNLKVVYETALQAGRMLVVLRV